MASVKRFNNNLVIQTSKDTGANITLDTDYVYVKGNLNVLGTQTSIQTVNSQITDNIFALNAGEPGSGVTAGTAGIEVDRGSLANVQIIWNENTDKWQLTTDGSTYANILSSTGSGSGLSAVIEDPAPALGGNLNTYGRTIFSNVGGVAVDGNIRVNYSSNPSAPTNAVALYAAAPNSAGSGLFVVNTNGNDELVTKTKAIVFSLIL